MRLLLAHCVCSNVDIRVRSRLRGSGDKFERRRSNHLSFLLEFLFGCSRRFALLQNRATGDHRNARQHHTTTHAYSDADLLRQVLLSLWSRTPFTTIVHWRRLSHPCVVVFPISSSHTVLRFASRAQLLALGFRGGVRPWQTRATAALVVVRARPLIRLASAAVGPVSWWWSLALGRQDGRSSCLPAFLGEAVVIIVIIAISAVAVSVVVVVVVTTSIDWR